MNNVMTGKLPILTSEGVASGRLPAKPTAGTCGVSLIIPTRNEEGNLANLVRKLQEVLADKDYEVILVDDSDDATPELAPRVAREFGLRLSVIHREGAERRGGLSTAVLAGIAAARGWYVCVMDADLQHPPELIGSMLEAAEGGEVDIVIASRYVKGGSDSGLSSGARRMISLASKRLVRTAFRSRLSTVTDPLSGFFLVRRSLLTETTLRPIGFKILLDILVRSDWRVAAEVPLRFDRRIAGSSKATLKQGRDFLAHVTRLAWERTTGEISAKDTPLTIAPGVTQAQS